MPRKIQSCRSHAYVHLVLTIMVLLSYTQSGLSQPNSELASVFSEGIFDTQWGQSLEEVSAIYPDAKIYDQGKSTSYYRIKDGRTIFSIDRKKSHDITFRFDNDKLTEVVVELSSSDWVVLRDQIQANFGMYNDNRCATIGSAADGRFSGTRQVWCDLASGIYLIESVGMSGLLGSSTFLTVQNRAIEKVESSKSELGF